MLLAGVTGQGRGATDRLLAGVAERLQQDGARLVGALRPVSLETSAVTCESDLWLLPDGPIKNITQDLGPASTACRMDAGAFEDAVGIVMARLQAGKADIVILNKFGLSEAEGRGFRAIIAEALALDVPVLTGLSNTHRAAFDRFAGGMASVLVPSETVVRIWCADAIKQASRAGAAL